MTDGARTQGSPARDGALGEGVCPRELRLLVVEDSSDDYELMLRRLSRAGCASSGLRVETEAALRDAFERDGWDAVIVDHVVPGLSGSRAIEVVRSVAPDVALVVVSGKVDEAVIAEDIRRGADDYVLKANLARLVPSLETALQAAARRREQRLAEEDARRQADLLEQVFECAPNVIMLVDRATRVRRINRAGLEMAGRPEAETLGLLCGDVFECLNAITPEGCGQTPDCPDCPVRSQVMETFRTGEPAHEVSGSLVLKRPARPVELDLLISTSLVRAHDEELCLLTISDQTRRLHAESALRESKDRYRRVVEGASEGLLELDPEYLIVDANDRWLEMMGYTRPAALGRRVHDFLFEEDLPDLEANRRQRLGGVAGRHERRFRRADGEELWAIVSAVPQMDGGVRSLQVVVEEVKGKCTSCMKPGDYFRLQSGRLYIPPDGHFCLYALHATLPLLPARQRPLEDGDWMKEEGHVICPDPAGNVIMKIEPTP